MIEILLPLFLCVATCASCLVIMALAAWISVNLICKAIEACRAIRNQWAKQ